MILMLLFITVCFLAFSNGANDNFKGVASLFGSGAATYKISLTWATVTTLAGSICALFIAQDLLVKFSGKGLAPDGLIQSIPFITTVAAGAGLTVILATCIGFPVSTTHALLGGLTGNTLLATGSVNLAALGSSLVLPLLLSPIVSLALATLIYSTFRLIRREKAISDELCLCTENPVDSAPLNLTATGTIALAPSTLTTLTLDNQAACDDRDAGVIFRFNLKMIIDGLHFVSAGAVCFARGLNDTPKITALLLLAPGFNLESKIALIAVAMAVGGLLNSRRIAETMSHKITTINHGQGLAANLTTAILARISHEKGGQVL